MDFLKFLHYKLRLFIDSDSSRSVWFIIFRKGYSFCSIFESFRNLVYIIVLSIVSPFHSPNVSDSVCSNGIDLCEASRIHRWTHGRQGCKSNRNNDSLWFINSSVSDLDKEKIPLNSFFLATLKSIWIISSKNNAYWKDVPRLYLVFRWLWLLGSVRPTDRSWRTMGSTKWVSLEIIKIYF